MVAYRHGFYEAFQEIYHRYSGRIYGYCRKKVANQASADDLFQLTFQKLHQSRHRYDPRYAFRAWIFTICHNAVTDYFRKEGRNRETLVRDYQAYAGAEPTDYGLMAGIGELEALPSLQKEAVKLRYDESLAFDEIARRLEVSSDYARQLVSRAVRRLRKLLSSG